MDQKVLAALVKVLAQRWVEQVNGMLVLAMTAVLAVLAGGHGWIAYATFATWCGVVALPALWLLLKKAPEETE